MLTSEIDKINFDQVAITSEETLTYNGDGSKTVIEWTDIEPTFLSKLSYKDGPYDLEQMQEIIQSAEWQPKEQDEATDTFISPTYPKEQDEESTSTSRRSILSRLVGN
jgi:hypothetical protein